MRSTAGVARRLRTFTDHHPWVGPVIYVMSVLYFLAQIVVGWVWKPPYSVVHNTISDLGNSVCGRYGKRYVCSPRHDLMNAAFIFLGVAMVFGSLLIYQEFAERDARVRVAARVGFSLLAIAGLGTILVGCFPENTVGAMHTIGAAMAIGLGNAGILILGLVLPLPDALRRYMVFFGVISNTALILFASGRYFGLGAGTMERIAAYPETLWMISFGIYLSRNHYRGEAGVARHGSFGARSVVVEP